MCITTPKILSLCDNVYILIKIIVINTLMLDNPYNIMVYKNPSVDDLNTILFKQHIVIGRYNYYCLEKAFII